MNQLVTFERVLTMILIGIVTHGIQDEFHEIMRKVKPLLLKYYSIVLLFDC